MVRSSRYENAPGGGSVGPAQAAEFWAAVEDCLVKFHGLARADAAAKVTDYWRRLANLTRNGNVDPQRRFDDMIYHEQPWYIACNLAEHEIPIEPNRSAYDRILRQNHLA